MKKASKSSKSFTTGSYAKHRARKSKALHATNSHFQSVFNYKKYHLLHKSQTYNKKRAARVGKYAKRMKTLTKAYKFDDRDAIRILGFLAEFKRACGSYGVYEGMALWILATLMKDRPASSLTVQITSHKDDGTTHRLRKTDEEQNFMYVEAVNFILKFCTTDSSVANAS